MRNNLRTAFIWTLVVVILTLVACGTRPETHLTPNVVVFFSPGIGASGQTILVPAQTRDVTRQIQTTDLATTATETAVNQQYTDDLATSTQKAVVYHVATQTEAAALEPTNTPTFREMLKDHIVFYLIQPEKNRQDACGSIEMVPIVSKRMLSGDKLRDVQVALQMLFNIKRRIYVQWYNALWDTDLTIDTYQYIAAKDYMTIDFAGYLPVGQLSNCDKHGIREQIWTTFFHYGIKEKTFKINGVFLIDQLSRKTK